MITHINSTEFKTLIFDYENKNTWVFLGNKPAIIKYGAVWCHPCKTITPILEDLSNEYDNKLDVYEVDVDESPELSNAFGIKSIPSVLFIPLEGQPEMMVGGLPKEKFKSAIKDVLKIN